ncbi:MAG: hypothetical protein HQK79_10170 [Desulfobacterales bacterium]|nr:hypothetical protein [Desulfobacterales bacterium]
MIRNSKKNIVFVIGIWPGSFLHNSTKWAKENKRIESEIGNCFYYKYDLWKKIPFINDNILIFAQPYLLLDKIYDFLQRKYFDPVLSKVLPYLFKPDFKLIKDSIENRKEMVQILNNQIEIVTCILHEEQFRILEKLTKEINSSGYRFVIVDMPIPSWVSKNLCYYEYYQNQKNIYINTILSSCNNGYYLNIQDLNSDTLFYDMTHPNVEGAKMCTNRVVTYLKDLR